MSVALAAPNACRECHGGFSEDSAFGTWAGSAMGHAARDPLFLSALTEAQKDYNGIGDLCLRCHAPQAWLEGRCVEPNGSLLTVEDFGVTCSVCHRMEPSPFVRNGQYVIGEDIEYRGPYADATAPHRHRMGSFISDSRLCGTCHDLRNPVVERRSPSGAALGMPFPEQATYTEWATSAYASGPEAKSCQDCHMPEGSGKVASEGPLRPDRSSHELSGGNVFLLGAVQFLNPGLGLGDVLARGRSKIEAQLRVAAKLEVLEAPTVVRRGERFSVRYRVTNLTGHKLPTGYPEGRRVWLQVESRPLGLSRGAFDETTGEPSSPAAIYHTKQGQLSVGAPGHRLALNDVIFLDTRIPPKGMVVTATTAPVGKAYAEISPGVLAGYDDVTVTATVPCDLGLGRVPMSATLWYQSVTKAYVDALVRENGADPRGYELAAAFEAADPGPFEMESTDLELAIDTASACASPDAGASDRNGDAGVGQDTGGSDDDSQDEGKRDGGCGCTATRENRRDGATGLGLIVIVASWCVRTRRRRNSQ